MIACCINPSDVRNVKCSVCVSVIKSTWLYSLFSLAFVPLHSLCPSLAPPQLDMDPGSFPHMQTRDTCDISLFSPTSTHTPTWHKKNSVFLSGFPVKIHKREEFKITKLFLHFFLTSLETCCRNITECTLVWP